MADSNQPPVADPASLQNLHDIVAPDRADWWPPAPGWYVLGVMLLIALASILVRVVSSYRTNRYRREGQMQLAKLRKLSHDSEHRVVAVAQTGQLLKRVALAGWPREDVAQLSGKRWLTFLNETGGGAVIRDQQGRVVLDILYCREMSERLSPAEIDELFEMADHWIRNHDRSISVANAGREDARC